MLYIPLSISPNLVSCHHPYNLEVHMHFKARLLYGILTFCRFSFTDWFFFMVLDIGNPAIDYIPLGVRFIIGLLQAVAVRAAGFGLVPLSALAPAVK
jgi:Trk-type K+ transport system membrane component